MNERNYLPELAADMDLGDFASSLRTKVFKSQRLTARHAGLNHTTVARYESGQLVPPLGYLAWLQALLIEDLALGGEQSDELVACRSYFAEQMRSLRWRYGSKYATNPAVRTWEHVEVLASCYRDEARGRCASEAPGELQTNEMSIVSNLQAETPYRGLLRDSHESLAPVVNQTALYGVDRSLSIGRETISPEVTPNAEALLHREVASASRFGSATSWRGERADTSASKRRRSEKRMERRNGRNVSNHKTKRKVCQMADRVRTQAWCRLAALLGFSSNRA